MSEEKQNVEVGEAIARLGRKLRDKAYSIYVDAGHRHTDGSRDLYSQADELAVIAIEPLVGYEPPPLLRVVSDSVLRELVLSADNLISDLDQLAEPVSADSIERLEFALLNLRKEFTDV